MKYFVSVLILAACTTPPVKTETALAPDELEGSWNITEITETGKAYSWIEVDQTDSGWEGLFLHRGGHPQPAEKSPGLAADAQL